MALLAEPGRAPVVARVAARRRVHLVRHGEVRYFDDHGQPVDPRAVPLTARGRVQAGALRDALRPVAIDRAVCSGLPRTRETAEILLEGRGLPLEEAPAFREIRAGRFRELPPERAQDLIAAAYTGAADQEGCFIGGDRFSAFAGRVVEAFRSLLAEPGWASLLLVAHDAVNWALLCHAMGCGLGAMAALEQDLACLNVIDIDTEPGGGDVFIVRAVNTTAYDPAKAEIRLCSMEHAALGYRPPG